MAWIEAYGQRSLAFEQTTEWKDIKNVRLVPWQLWTIMSVVILSETVILHLVVVVEIIVLY